MPLELTRNSNKEKKPKNKNGGPKKDAMLKFFEFFEKNPILKIIIPVLLFAILAGIFVFVIFGDGVLRGKDDASAGTPTQSETNTVDVLPGNNTITDEDVVSLIEKDPLSADILATAKYTGYAVGSSGLKTALVQIGTNGDTLVLSLGETVGDSSWTVTELTKDYVIFSAGKLTKKLEKK